MDFVGDRFTWRRGQIRERLNRALANPQWVDMFAHAALINSEMPRSDHRSILLDMSYFRGTHGSDSGVKRRFEARWLQEETVEEIIKTAWARASSRGEGPRLMDKVSEVHVELHRWDKELLKRPSMRIKALEKDLEQLRRGPMNDNNIAAQKEVMIRIELLLEQEEIH